MPEAEPLQLRLYCICGQRMRVSPSMFGKPGKCVACRQKLRIPTAAELPPDTTEIYLKDYPQLLRKPLAPARGSKRTKDLPLPEEEEVFGEESDSALVPLDDLEDLRLICSYDHKIQRKLKKLQRGGGSAEDKSALMGYRSLVRTAREGLDRQIRDFLDNVRDQLTAIEEDLIRAGLAVRSGDIDYHAYAVLVNTLRHQREILVRRQRNLRAWLEIQDPDLAGGYSDLSLEEVPVEPPKLRFASPPRDTDIPVIRTLVEQLREALKAREAVPGPAPQRNKQPADAARDRHAEGRARLLRLRSAAAVGFARARLEQVLHDCEADAKSLKAQLILARERLGEGALNKGAYHDLEISLLRAQSDNARVHALAQEALEANAPAEVPHANSTLMMRLRRAAGSKGAEGRMDLWFAFAAVAAMVAAILLPVIPHAHGSNVLRVPGLVLGLVLTAAMFASTAAVPARPVRGAVYTLLFFAGGLGAIVYLYSVWQSDSASGAAMRNLTQWYLSPGILALIAAAVLSGTAAGIALAPFPRWRLWPVLSAVIVTGVLVIAGTNFGGLLVPKLTVDEPEFSLAETELGPYNTVFAIHNQGWRTLWLGASAMEAPIPAELSLERRTPNGLWQDAGLPLSLKVNHEQWHDPVVDSRLRPVELRAGEAAYLRYALLPGTYRLQVALAGAAQVVNRTFEVPASMAIAERMRMPAVYDDNADLDYIPGTQDGPAASLHAAETLTLVLNGVIDGEGHRPRFYISVTLPNSRPMSRYLDLGEPIYGKWIAQEYNPATKGLVVSDGETVIVVKAGEQVKLEYVSLP